MVEPAFGVYELVGYDNAVNTNGKLRYELNSNSVQYSLSRNDTYLNYGGNNETLHWKRWKVEVLLLEVYNLKEILH